MQILCEQQRPYKAQTILQRMLAQDRPDLRPDVVAYTALMDGWAAYAKSLPLHDDDNTVSTRESAVTAVFDLLHQMKERAITLPELAPNHVAYTAVLKTLAAARLPDAGRRAQQVLAEMWDDETPGTIHYNAAVDCCAKASRRATRALDAAQLWREMREAGIPADTITYNTILNAAANAFGSPKVKQESLEIGRRAFAALQQDNAEDAAANGDCRPTSLTYSFYFKMLRRLVVDEADRFKWTKEAFDQCCAQGCLNEIVWKQVLQAAPSDKERRALLGDHHYSLVGPRCGSRIYLPSGRGIPWVIGGDGHSNSNNAVEVLVGDNATNES